MLGQLFNLFNQDMPKELADMLKYVTFLNFNMVSFMSISCLATVFGGSSVVNLNGFYPSFLSKVAMPFVVVALFYGVYAYCSKKTTRCEMKKQQTTSTAEVEKLNLNILKLAQYKVGAPVPIVVVVACFTATVECC